ncbi:hypothetical protein [Bremerella alba]|uniref:Arylsulfatase n=1 Tax=Bremerella alba TaxID=980252 RepID=A0A7V9A6L2_9BACT|nr:hypothetical protein [Bremerella alba]
MQLFDLSSDPSEQENLVESHPEQVKQLLELLKHQVEQGRCTPGEKVANDRKVTFLPDDGA